MKDMLIQILRSKTLFFLNGIVYYLDRDNVSERLETALNQTEREGSYLLNYHSLFDI